MSYPNRIQEVERTDQRSVCTSVSRLCFVEEAAGVESFVASQGGVSFLLDAEGQKLFVCADKAELPAKFVHLLK